MQLKIGSYSCFHGHMQNCLVHKLVIIFLLEILGSPQNSQLVNKLHLLATSCCLFFLCCSCLFSKKTRSSSNSLLSLIQRKVVDPFITYPDLADKVQF